MKRSIRRGRSALLPSMRMSLAKPTDDRGRALFSQRPPASCRSPSLFCAICHSSSPNHEQEMYHHAIASRRELCTFSPQRAAGLRDECSSLEPTGAVLEQSPARRLPAGSYLERRCPLPPPEAPVSTRQPRYADSTRPCAGRLPDGRRVTPVTRRNVSRNESAVERNRGRDVRGRDLGRAGPREDERARASPGSYAAVRRGWRARRAPVWPAARCARRPARSAHRRWR